MAIAFATLLISVALLLVKPWTSDRGRYGVVSQVPVETSARDIDSGVSIGQLAPNFLLQSIDGEEVRLSDLRGKPVFLNFWATWCIFCASEMPAMQRLANAHAGDLLVVGVNVGESQEEAVAFARQTGIEYLLLLDADRDVTRAYTILSMPTTYLIDENGVIAAVRFGVLTPPEMEEIVGNLVSAE